MAGDYVALANSGDVGALQAALKEAFTHIFITRYLTLIGLVLLLYDHLLTIPEEISAVWKKKKSLVSWIFLANRYGVPFILAIDLYDKAGLSGGLSKQFCQFWTLVENHLHLLSHASIHALVALRVSAIWGHQNVIKWTVALSWAASSAATFTLGSYSVFHSYKSFYFDEMTQLCFGTIVTYSWALWIPPMVLESLLFVLTVARARKQHRTSIRMLPFAQILYRDGFIYFVIISLCSALNLILWKFAPVSLMVSAKYFTFGVVNVTASRMVLNLRAQGGVASYESEDDHGYSHFVDAMSHEQRAVVSAARDRDVEDQHIAQVQLRSMKVSRPSAVVRKPSHASRGSRRPATSPGGRNPTGPSRFQRPHRASAEGTFGVTQFDMEMWERSLPRETAHQHLQVQKKPRQSDDEGRSERTVDIEVSSSDTSIMGYAPGSKKKPRHQDRHF